MNIKKSISSLAVALAVTAITASTGCSEWTQPEPENHDRFGNTETSFSADYYKALREYKKSDHEISFGWFSGWGEPSVLTASMLAGLPDSMDMISLWDSAGNLSAGKQADLKEVQQKKGTKVLMCTFMTDIGNGFTPAEHNGSESARKEFWGWKDGDETAIKASMDRYAKAICDTINKYGYDGIDFDIEPDYGYSGHLVRNTTYVGWLLESVGKYLGPQSGSGKLLVIDGEIWYIPAYSGIYIDYFIAQAYSVSGGTPSPTAGVSASNMETRLSQIVNHYRGFLSEEEVTNKFIVTENMESAIDALNGGYYWIDARGIQQDKKECPSLVGMASWKPRNGYRKGGFGGYKFNNEAVNNPSYKWMRTAIQTANPANTGSEE
ncbi:MAG: endo-beta-N-acetylglucosaminidase [Alistipes sp.]|nr:endo-beta-N-acetylglucosaminidase [Alistipes sp.]